MLIGARTADWCGGGYVNPYPTEGLVAMWDGVDGIYNESVKTWIDIIGRKQMVLEKGPGGIATGSCLKTNLSTYRCHDDEIYAASSGPWTLQVSSYVDPLESSIGYYSYSMETYNSKKASIASEYRGISHLAKSWGSGETIVAEFLAGISYRLNSQNIFTGYYHRMKFIQFTATYDGSTIEFFGNAVRKFSYGISDMQLFDEITIGSPESVRNTNIYGLRMYRRILSQSEIEATYATDSERFVS